MLITKAGVSEYQIIEFIPRIYDDCLKEMIESVAAM
jgi:hypothetical protein